MGAELECEERLHGKLHSMRFRTTRVIPDRRLEFAIQGMGRGAFEAQPCQDAVTFIAELDIGSEMPVIGPAFDFIFRRFFPRRIEAMRQHMAEEGRNLKAILETGAPSSPDLDAA
jgi:hypothetical protein